MTQQSPLIAADHVVPYYVQQLDLAADPFADLGGGHYFYSGGGRRHLLDQVVHFSRFSDQPVLLIGSTGSGTSTLLRAMSDQLYELMDSCIIDGTEINGVDQLLQAMAEQLRLDKPVSVADFLLNLKHSAMVNDEPEPVLIAIDQAHYLSLEILQLLHSLFTGSAGTVHLLLVGEYQIEPLTKLAGFNQEALKVLELEPLTLNETDEYVLGLLRSEAYAGEQPLGPDQLAVLFEQSAGNITEINQLAPALLNAKPAAVNTGLSFPIPKLHLLAISLLTAALLLSWLLQEGDEPMAMSQAQSIDSAIVESQVSPRNSTELLLPLTVDRTTKVGTQATARSVATTPAATTTVAIASDTPPISTAQLDSKPDLQGINTAGTIASVGIENSPASKPAAGVPVTKPSQVASAIEAATATVTEAKTEPVSTANAALASTAPPKSTATTTPPRERQLLQLAQSAYMLQLMGAVEEARIRNFVKQYIGRLPLSYFESRRNGAPWYVAVSGPYSDKASARSAIQTLPSELQKQQPWARSVVGIQTDIRRNRQ